MPGKNSFRRVGLQRDRVSRALALLCRSGLAGVDDRAVLGRPNGNGLLGEPVEEEAPGP